MKRLLATTAIAFAFGTSAFAQDASTMSYDVQAEDFYATALIGARIYGVEALDENPDAMIDVNAGYEDIGEINDLVVAEDGSVQAVIVGVGGFLGIGEKDVALSMDSVNVMSDADGERYLVVAATADTLNDAPAFEYPSVGNAMTVDGESEGSPDSEAAVVTDDSMTEDTMETDSEAADAAASETTIESDAATELAQENAVTDDTTEVEPLSDAETMAETEAMTPEAEMATDDTVVVEDGMATDGMTAPADVSILDGYTEVAVTDLTADELTGTNVVGMNDDNLGQIGDLILAEDGMISAAIIDFGGFLGIGQKQVQVSFDDLSIMQNADTDDMLVMYDATREQLEAMPEYEG